MAEKVTTTSTLMPIEPPIPPSADWLQWLTYGGWFFAFVLAGLGILWFLRRFLPAWRFRWQKAVWLRQLYALPPEKQSSAALKTWLLQHYATMQSWQAAMTPQQVAQWQSWLFSPAPVSRDELIAWIEQLPTPEMTLALPKWRRQHG